MLVRRKHELEVKIKKRGKVVGDEAISKAIKEIETAQENLDKAKKQQAALIKKLEVEDKEEVERLEKLQMDPILMYTHPDYGNPGFQPINPLSPIQEDTPIDPQLLALDAQKTES